MKTIKNFCLFPESIKPIIRSPLFYVGDKFKLLKEILKHFPTQIATFVEPFVGGGSVFLNVEAQKFLLNDIDSYIIALHQFLCSQAENPQFFFENLENLIQKYGFSYSYQKDVVPEKLKKLYPKTYYAHYNKKAYQALKSDFNQSSQKDMLQLYLLLIYGFNRMLRFNTKGEFNLPVGNVDFNENVWQALNDYFEVIQQKEIQWFNLDYQDFLAQISLSPADFLYFDPPYLITFSEYNKLWGEIQEKNLIKTLNDLHQRGLRFAVSNVVSYKGRENTIFKEWAKNFKIIPIKSNYISYHDNSIKQFEEVLVCNYEKSSS
ncbi:MAG: Dam family site-specific DNA-(adenine-N6)-methyltransferase [Raineya sp.]|nr:Dam family site-specific DNA-(adenine-N6)-methyltransferase [Raineya sp.]MDW8295402.1 Dam family site-specific DNA-(adenine-N6)-methyltransferase [Raineya sp.]